MAHAPQPWVQGLAPAATSVSPLILLEKQIAALAVSN